MSQNPLDAILSTLDPALVRETILRLANRGGGKREVGVSMPMILDEIIGHVDLGHGAAHWRASMAIKSAIISTLEDVPDMRYVDGDA